MVDIEVRARITGRSGELPAVLVRLAAERTTAGELIRRAVEEQVRLLRADAAHCLRVLDQHYPCDVADPARALDVEAEVLRAQRAFEHGQFTLFAGGRQITGLDAEVVVRIGEPVTFLRLVALAGG
ncbi:hypothetical protein BJY16_007182 [Actinoplanes octamycinicus]|uniref:Uncharacterized protein n=1 Tax=Actinoplanes octamycinicus TaxID=135948 RepID=A0A7W7H4F2_9ACTN|nr:hypothetical protein [Actinoplanes octamycinicus]MBB4743723.1 hypothetical protein [Actinoplanes octamycinicus]GIE61153.1 hypothetical protein Aoc01nite_65550 [Actinoplanes octamycinicus]